MRRKQRTKKPESDENSKSTNVTQERLADLPFRSAKALKEAQEQIRLQVWRRMEEAKVINEMIRKKEYQFWHDEFRHGLICVYEEKADASLVRVFSEGEGIRININKGLADAAPSSEAVLGTLVKAMSESFAITYYRAKGILHPSDEAKKDSPLAAQ